MAAKQTFLKDSKALFSTVIKDVNVQIYKYTTDFDYTQLQNTFAEKWNAVLNKVFQELKDISSDYKSTGFHTLIVYGPVCKTTKTKLLQTKWFVGWYSFVADSLNYVLDSCKYTYYMVSVNVTFSTGNVQISSPTFKEGNCTSGKFTEILRVQAGKLSKKLKEITYILGQEVMNYYPKAPHQIYTLGGSELPKSIQEYYIQHKYDGFRLIIKVEATGRGSFCYQGFTRHGEEMNISSRLYDLCKKALVYMDTPFILECEVCALGAVPSQAMACLKEKNTENLVFVFFNAEILSKPMGYKERYELMKKFIPNDDSKIYIPEIIKVPTNEEDIAEFLLGKIENHDSVEGLVFWDVNEMNSEPLGLFKYKSKFKIRVKVDNLVISGNGEGIVCECTSTKEGLSVNATLHGTKDLILSIIEEWKKTNEIPPILQGEVEVSYLAASPGNKLRSPLLSLPDLIKYEEQ